MTEQSTTVTQCPKFKWCVMGHAHKGECSTTHYTFVEANEPRVEAGDRALETAREISHHYPKLECDGAVTYMAALIQSAMNAQERELRATLRQFISQVELATLTDNDRFMFENTVRDAERLLAERGEGEMNTEMVSIYQDGDQMCALIGANIQEGIAGFGNTVGDALRDLATAVDNEGWTQF